MLALINCSISDKASELSEIISPVRTKKIIEKYSQHSKKALQEVII